MCACRPQRAGLAGLRPPSGGSPRIDGRTAVCVLLQWWRRAPAQCPRCQGLQLAQTVRAIFHSVYSSVLDVSNCRKCTPLHFVGEKVFLVNKDKMVTRKYRMWIPLLFSFIRSGLLVGLEEAEGSVLCLYDLGLSRVVKAVVIPGRVSLHFGNEMLIMWFVHFCTLQEFGKTAANFVCLLFFFFSRCLDYSHWAVSELWWSEHFDPASSPESALVLRHCGSSNGSRSRLACGPLSRWPVMQPKWTGGFRSASLWFIRVRMTIFIFLVPNKLLFSKQLAIFSNLKSTFLFSLSVPRPAGSH